MYIVTMPRPQAKKSKKVSPRAAKPAAERPATASWTFLTNHSHVLLCIYRQPDIRLRDVAELVGITERMVQKVVSDLAVAGYMQVERLGRRNVYRVLPDRTLRHPLESAHSIGELLAILAPQS